MSIERIKCLIIGSGPAGYTAAIYASRANLQPVLYEGIQPGGQLTTTTEIDNFPGYPDGIDGQEMMEQLKNQSIRFGTDVRFGLATKADLSQRPFKITIDDDKEILAETVIISTGATAKYLGLESEEKYKGQGVSACATCDGFFYKGKDVAVVGGGDTACEEASYLAGLCNKVYMIVRRDELRASKVMQERVKATPNIEILWEHQTKEITGSPMGGVNGAILVHKNGTEKKIDIHVYFVAIGHHPNSELFSEWVNTN
jgi:thioredoxin reductase (NADPH)